MNSEHLLVATLVLVVFCIVNGLWSFYKLKTMNEPNLDKEEEYRSDIFWSTAFFIFVAIIQQFGIIWSLIE